MDAEEDELAELERTLQEVQRLEALLEQAEHAHAHVEAQAVAQEEGQGTQTWKAGDVAWVRDDDGAGDGQATVVEVHDGEGAATVLFVTPRSAKAVPCATANCTGGRACTGSHGERVRFEAMTAVRPHDLEAVRGAVCLARYRDDGVWYPARLVRRRPDGTADVVFVGYEPDETAVGPADVLPLPPGEAPGNESGGDSAGTDDDGDGDGDADDDEGGEGAGSAGDLATARLANHDAMAADGYELGGWERFTRGIGSKLMARMGYRHVASGGPAAVLQGSGLGRNSQGRVRPVEVEVLGRGRSLDFLDEDREHRRGGRLGTGKAGGRGGGGGSGHRRRRRGRAASTTVAAKPAPPAATDVFDFLNKRIAEVAAAAPPEVPRAPAAGAGAAAFADGGSAGGPSPKEGNGTARFAPSPKATVHVQLVEVQQERERVRAKYVHLKATHGRLSGDAVTQRVIRDKLAVLHQEHERLAALEKQLVSKRDGDKLRRSLTSF